MVHEKTKVFKNSSVFEKTQTDALTLYEDDEVLYGALITEEHVKWFLLGINTFK